MLIFTESRYKVTWRSKVGIDHMVWSIPSHNLQRDNAKARSNVATLMKLKRNEVATINIMQAQVEEVHFIFNLEFRYAALSRGMLHRLSTKSHAQQSLKTQVRWEKQYDHKHSTSHWTWENRMVRFSKPDGPVSKTGWSGFQNRRVRFWQMSSNGYISISGCFGLQNRMFRFLLASSQRLVFGGQV